MNANTVPDTALGACVRSHNWSNKQPWTTCGTSQIPLTAADQVPWPLNGNKTEAVVNGYNGAAVDPNRMYFHGGGHNTYGGNEVIGFNYHTLKWDFYIPIDAYEHGSTRDDYSFEDFAQDKYPSGGPNSTHTYDGTIYVPWTGQVLRFAGYGYWPNGSSVGNGYVSEVFAFSVDDPEAGWFHVQSMPNKDELRGCQTSVKTRLLPDQKMVEVRCRSRARAYDPVAHEWGNYRSAGSFESQGLVGTAEGGSVVYLSHGGATKLWIDGEEYLPYAPWRNAGQQLCNKQGVDWHPERDLLVAWCGQRDVWAYDYRTNSWSAFPNPNGPAPTRGGSAGTFDKWRYLPDYDVFIGYDNVNEGVWFYRLPDQPQENPERAALEDQGYTCADGFLNWGCPDLQATLEGGETLPKGVYDQGAKLTESGTYDLNDARLVGDFNGKGTLLTNADPITLNNVRCDGIRVSDGNGACVRMQNTDLTINGLHVRDSQGGILANPDAASLTINDVDIAGVGGDCSIKCGRAHGIYYNTANPESVLMVDGGTIARGKDEGHLVKTGAARTVLENLTLDERDGNQSRAIDAYNGGELILRNVTIYANSGDGNPDIIGWNFEKRDVNYAADRIVFDDVTVHCDAGSRLIGYRSDSQPVLEGLDTVKWPNGRC